MASVKMHHCKMHFLCVFLLSLASGVELIGNDKSLGCRIENGEPVDWYYLYKLPKEPSEHDSPTNGLRYVYVSSKDEHGEDILRWNSGHFTVNQSESAPGSTIVQPLSNEPTTLTIIYNDEPANGPVDGERGHTKGVVSTDGKTGYWLIHSVPKFPPQIGTGYSYPHTGMLYGQSFLCISLDGSQMETVGHQLLFNEVNVYSARIPSHLTDRFPMLTRAAKMLPGEKSPPFYSQQTIRSAGGVEFVTFAKSRLFAKELYADWIAPTLDVGLLVESWQHGAGNLPSECSGRPHAVMNVQEVSIDGKERFATLKDHSKWAVDESAESRWICVGDINRQEHQKQRGGGSVCRLSPDVAGLYRGMVDSVEPCPKSEGTVLLKCK
ncbi:deoxyribonuclease-2-alpha [Anopheles coustani]|uniref:deoxyribonuclease-2-alpha n=2 Tax=coustani group TaxID=59130 RepID=UPI00265812D1|nr:deoxyribonuclease-2-alpha [Anopheles coustani]